MLKSSFQNSIPYAFAGMELAFKEQGLNLGGAMVGHILIKVKGVQSIPEIQKYHIKGKRRGALVKGQAMTLL